MTVVLLLLSVGVAFGNTDRWTTDDVEDAIRDASISQGVSNPLLTCIATRESHMDPYATSPWGDAGAFQFHQSSDGSTLMDLTPWTGRSPYDPYASAHATAWLINRGYGPHWSTYYGCL